MPAADKIRSGELEAALAELQAEVRKAPADPKLRVFLFQLLAVLGQWDRARNQLGVLAEMDPTASSLVRTYGALLAAETTRARVLSGADSPTIFGDPEPWMALLLEAFKLLAAGRLTEAASLRDRAFADAPAVTGKIDGKPFEWIADADPRFGPMLEAVVNGRYLWIPFSRLRKLEVEAPADLRDFVWAAAHLTFTNGGETVAFLPARYPGSEAATEGALRLGRKTEWRDAGALEDGYSFGLGQRMLATEATDVALLDARSIELDTPAAPVVSAPPTDESAV